MPLPAAPSLKPVQELANDLGLLEDELTPYGRYKGEIGLADAVVRACEQPSSYRLLYEDTDSIERKLETIARRLYGADGVTCRPTAVAQIKTAARLGYGHFPICMAKTQYSLSHDPQLPVGRGASPFRFANCESLRALSF